MLGALDSLPSLPLKWVVMAAPVTVSPDWIWGSYCFLASLFSAVKVGNRVSDWGSQTLQPQACCEDDWESECMEMSASVTKRGLFFTRWGIPQMQEGARMLSSLEDGHMSPH